MSHTQSISDHGPLLKLIEGLFPDATDRHKLLWETPCALFGFSGSDLRE
jgi:predicted TIM-barrel fold metal-dependent hydrolase